MYTLLDHKNTDFGKDHSFDKIKTHKDNKKQENQ